jgi:hypothetical protein
MKPLPTLAASAALYQNWRSSLSGKASQKGKRPAGSAPEGLGKRLLWLELESEFGGDLQSARAAIAEEGVADADVTCGV